MKNIFIVILSCFMFTTLFGQSIKIEDVRKKEFRGVSAIIDESTGEAEGYYTFYANSKVKKGQREFVIAIFDTDLNLVKQTPIMMDKKSVMQSSTFNGDDFLFCFNGMSLSGFGKKSVSYISIDRKGEIIKTKGVKLKGVKGMFEMEAEVYPCPQGGFYIVKPLKEKKWGYSVERVTRDLRSLWEKRFMPNKGFLSVQAIESTGGGLMIVHEVARGLMSKKVELELRVLNEDDGAERFVYPLFDGKHTFTPTSFVVNDQQDIILGGMYFEGNKKKNTNSNGIFFLRLDGTGKQQVSTITDWDDGLQKHLKSARKSVVIGSKPKVIFHEITIAEDGTYQVIGETYKTTFNAAGAFIGKVGSNKRDIGDPQDSRGIPMGFRIEDFIVFNFNKEGQIVNINKIEKDPIKYKLWSPYNVMGGLKLARMMQSAGYFDFAFTTKKKDSDQEIIVSSSMALKKPYIGLISIDNGEVSEMHKIEVENKLTKQASIREDSFVGVVKSKPGYICIYFYDKKEKTVNMYLEEIKLK